MPYPYHKLARRSYTSELFDEWITRVRRPLISNALQMTLTLARLQAYTHTHILQFCIFYCSTPIEQLEHTHYILC
jgi:hypothetical protein